MPEDVIPPFACRGCGGEFHHPVIALSGSVDRPEERETCPECGSYQIFSRRQDFGKPTGFVQLIVRRVRVELPLSLPEFARRMGDLLFLPEFETFVAFILWNAGIGPGVE